MNKLVILDYSNGNVHIYNIDSNFTKVDENYIESLGYNYSNCFWIIGDLNIQFHKGILSNV